MEYERQSNFPSHPFPFSMELAWLSSRNRHAQITVAVGRTNLALPTTWPSCYRMLWRMCGWLTAAIHDDWSLSRRNIKHGQKNQAYKVTIKHGNVIFLQLTNVSSTGMFFATFFWHEMNVCTSRRAWKYSRQCSLNIWNVIASNLNRISNSNVWEQCIRRLLVVIFYCHCLTTSNSLVWLTDIQKFALLCSVSLSRFQQLLI